MGLGTALKRLPKLDPFQEVLPGPDSVLLLGTLGGASVVMVGLGAVKAAAPSNFWHLGAVPPLRGSEWYCWSGWLVGLCLITLAL